MKNEFDNILVSIKELKVHEADEKKPRNSRIHVFHKGVGPESLFGIANRARWNHPADLYRQVVVPEALKALNLPLSTPIRWSQKAGCSCGCSPGFIVSDNEGHKEVFVTIEIAEKQLSLSFDI